MNYDWRYDSTNGPDSFWSHFEFRFDDEELVHLRHGNRSAVIMGGDPWVRAAISKRRRARSISRRRRERWRVLKVNNRLSC